MKRKLAKIEKESSTSHKGSSLFSFMLDRVQEFNSKLARLSEHNDIPRVGPG
jgi:translation elongation factor EF-1alpha